MLRVAFLVFVFASLAHAQELNTRDDIGTPADGDLIPFSDESAVGAAKYKKGTWSTLRDEIRSASLPLAGGNLTGNTSTSANLALTAGYLDISEIATPAAPGADIARIYARPNAATGGTELYFSDAVKTTNLSFKLEDGGKLTTTATLAKNNTYLTDASSGSFTTTLPAATGSRKRVRITPEDASNAVTVAVQSGESLDGTTDGTDSVDSLGIYEYVDAGTGTWISTANDFYSRDGSLSGDRTVTVGPHTLNFLGGSVFSSQYLANAALQLNDTTINLNYGTSTQFQGVTITDGVAGDTTINITGDITNPEINSIGFWVENADAITRNVVFNSAIKDADGSTNLGTVALAAGAEILFAWVKNGTTYTTIYRSDGLDFLPLSGGTMTGNLLMGTNILSLGDSSLVDDGDLEIEANGNTVFTMTDALVTSEVDLAVSGDVDINGGYLEMTEMGAPADPPANTGRLYVADAATTTKLYFRDNAGAVKDLLGGSFGEYYISTPAASAAITAGVPIEIGGTATAGDSSADFTIATTAGGRATYTGALTKRFRVTAHVSATSTKGNEVMSIFIAEGGTALAKSESERKIGTGSDTGSVSTSAIVELATNEFIEVFVDLGASTSDTITAQKCVVVITEI